MATTSDGFVYALRDKVIIDLRSEEASAVAI